MASSSDLLLQEEIHCGLKEHLGFGVSTSQNESDSNPILQFESDTTIRIRYYMVWQRVINACG
jgi:hypothetical protein